MVDQGLAPHWDQAFQWNVRRRRKGIEDPAPPACEYKCSYRHSGVLFAFLYIVMNNLLLQGPFRRFAAGSKLFEPLPRPLERFGLQLMHAGDAHFEHGGDLSQVQFLDEIQLQH